MVCPAPILTVEAAPRVANPPDFGVGAHQPRRGQVVHPHRGDSHVDAGSAEHDHRLLLGLVPGGQVAGSRRAPGSSGGHTWTQAVPGGHSDMSHTTWSPERTGCEATGWSRAPAADGENDQGSPGWRGTSRTRSPSATSHPRSVVRTCPETPTPRRGRRSGRGPPPVPPTRRAPRRPARGDRPPPRRRRPLRPSSSPPGRRRLPRCRHWRRARVGAPAVPRRPTRPPRRCRPPVPAPPPRPPLASPWPFLLDHPRPLTTGPGT